MKKTLELYRKYFEEILSPSAETGLIEFATISEVGRLYEETEEKGISMLPQIITVVNGNYFDDDTEAEKAVSNLRKQIEICEKCSVDTEHYFTPFSWTQTNELDGGYYSWVSSKDGVDIHCHGENRNPPDPSLIGRMNNNDWERDYNLAFDFQTHVVEIETGKITDDEGGAKTVLESSGIDVVSCGRAVKGAILKANKDIGFNVGVGFGDSMGVPSNRCFMMDVLGRPDDIFIHPNDEFLPWVKGRYDLKSEVLEEIRKLDYFEPRYLMFVIHDWDMFRYVDETKAWEHYEEVLRWLTEDIGCEGSSIEEMYEHANHRGVVEQEWIDYAANELIEDIKNDGELNNYYGSDGKEVTLSELFQGCLLDREFKPKDIIGPTEIFGDEKEMVLSKKEFESLIEKMQSEITDWQSIPESFAINNKTISAGQMLYVLCQKKTDDVDGIIEIPPISNNPEQAYSLRFDFDKLQLWTHRPAYYSY